MTGTEPAAVVTQVIRHSPCARSVRQTDTEQTKHHAQDEGAREATSQRGEPGTRQPASSGRVWQRGDQLAGYRESGEESHRGQGSAWLGECTAHREGGNRRQEKVRGARLAVTETWLSKVGVGGPGPDFIPWELLAGQWPGLGN